MSSANSGDSRQDFDRPIGAFLDHPELSVLTITSEHVRQAFTKHHVLFGSPATSSSLGVTLGYAQWVTGIDVLRRFQARVSLSCCWPVRPGGLEDGVFCRPALRHAGDHFVQELAWRLWPDQLSRLPVAALALARPAYLPGRWHRRRRLDYANQLAFPNTPNQKRWLARP